MKSVDGMPVTGRVGGRDVVALFDGGVLSSDGGLLLLGEAEREVGLLSKMAQAVRDKRQPGKVRQAVLAMLTQRVFGIACGYEDCNDFDTLASDPLFKLSCSRLPLSGDDLASQPTLSRWENSVTRKDLYRLSEALLSVFLERHKEKPPKRIVLDADATDDACHGQQELEFYHGYYQTHCFLPLLVHATADDGEQELIAAVLRPGNVHAGHKSVAVLKRLVKRLKAAFPDAEVVFRGDAGFALPSVYQYLEDEEIPYVISLPKNERLLALSQDLRQAAKERHEQTQEKVRLFGEVRYAAKTWEKERRVVVKAEVLEKGENPRFVVTSLSEAPEAVYGFYTKRGDVENRIKELKDDLLSGRTSCHRFLANQFRLLLHAAAFVLVQAIRRRLKGTEWEKAQVNTLRVRLFKVAAKVVQTTRRIVVHLPTSYPWQDRFTELIRGPAQQTA
jgi:hypothetical protein